jgi:[ribosomal protein S18]-alanine N-acetyltransferase
VTAWQLRRATVDDLDAIMTLETVLFASDAWSRSMMKAELSDRHSYYLVAFPVVRSSSEAETPSAELIQAYAGLRAPRGQPQADIQTIGVADSARRQGLGRVLMLQMIGEARDRGATEVFLEVRADNPGAQALYDSLGFEPIAVRPKYYQPDGVDAVIMRLTIAAPRLEPTSAAARE